MRPVDPSISTPEIIAQARQLGASIAGIAAVAALKRSPSHLAYGKLGAFEGIRPKDPEKPNPAEVFWPQRMPSAVVFGIEHPIDQPQLDWWQEGLEGGTPGNRQLMKIGSRLAEWMIEKAGVTPLKLPYHIENGGIFLKDAAVLAGLGCIGKNNLFVSPSFGPQVRLRALLLDIELPATGPVEFDPCQHCHEPCLKVCPQNAFDPSALSTPSPEGELLSGRSGTYSRDLCNRQMRIDSSSGVSRSQRSSGPFKYCRRCETACPVGKNHPIFL
jgi:epoxyqueuosine reductase